MAGRLRVRTAALSALAALVTFALPSTSVGPVSAAPATVRAYFLGDSLMAGTGVTPRRPVMARVAATRLGWDVNVDAWGGTGYTTTGRSPDYLTRLRRPGALQGSFDLVLLEGGTNDARHAGDPQRVHDAIVTVIEEVRRRQPRARIVLMGAYDPPRPGRVVPGRTVADGLVRQVAREQGLPFFSPLSGRWTVGQGPAFLSADRLHPSAQGYGVMGEHLARELRAAVSRPAPQQARRTTRVS